MISQLRGTTVALGPNWAVVDVGGVGFKVSCTPATAAGLRLGTECTLATTLIVREDALTLFGFADTHERAAFELLQLASGVGPKLALAVISGVGVEGLPVCPAFRDGPRCRSSPALRGYG